MYTLLLLATTHHVSATRERKMSKLAATSTSSVNTLFGRLLAGIDRLLLSNAAIAIRNGDVPRVGL